MIIQLFRVFVGKQYSGPSRPKAGLLASRISFLALASALLGSIFLPVFDHLAYGQQQFTQPPPSFVLVLPFAISEPADGTITNDNTPTIAGTKPADVNSVSVYDDNSGAYLGTATSDTSFWSLTPGSPLPDGAYTLTAYLLTGCEFNCQEDSVTFTIDTVPPKSPAITQPPDNNITNNNMPIFAGYAETGSAKVEVFDEGAKLGEAASISSCYSDYASDSAYYSLSIYVPSTISWCFIPQSPLSEGLHEITAVATDGAGNVSPESNMVEVTIDTTPPQTSASPAGGGYALQQPITLSSNEPGVIYYTIDGTMPTTSTSAVYDSPIILADPSLSSLTLNFFAIDLAGNSESVKTESYVVSADNKGPDGSVEINSGDTYTEVPEVNVELVCNDPESGCKAITLVWENKDLNTRSTAIDAIEDVSVSAGAAGNKYSFTAFETGPNTGTFAFTFSNDDSYGNNYLGFEDGEEIDVSDLPLSADNGTKWVRALFQDSSGNTSQDEDSIELGAGGQPGVDPFPPVISEPVPLVKQATGSLTILSLEPPKVTDNMDPSPKITSDAPANGFPYGTTVVTWTATDSAGNTASAEQKVTVVGVFIDSISNDAPYWEQDFVLVSGTVEGVDGGRFTVAVDWGDGMSSEGITITSSGEWGPARHSYSADSMRAASNREIVAKLVESEDDTGAASAPSTVIIQKHPTKIALIQDDDVNSSDEISGMLVDALTDSGLAGQTVIFSSADSTEATTTTINTLPVTTSHDGSFLTRIGTLPSGSIPRAEFTGDELYLPSSTDDSNSVPLTISIRADREEYRLGDEVVATGRVSKVVEGEVVNLRLIADDGSIIAETSAPVMSDQTYSSRFDMGGETLTGTYTIEALYADSEATTTFGYGAANHAPVADPGPDVKIDPTTISEGSPVVQLDGTKSSDPDGDVLSYQWDQISGPTVELRNADSATPSFTLPKVDAVTEVIFQLRVTDGFTSDTKTVKASILPLVAPASDGNATIYYLAGGGAAAVAAGSTLGFKYFRPKRPKVPLLRWHVFAPHTIQEGGNAYIDVIVNNFGEADGKNIKLAVESAELECDPGTTIETLMPLESRKFSFRVRQRNKGSPTTANNSNNNTISRVRISLESTWSAKKELIPLLTNSEIKWNPKKEKTVEIASRTIRVGLLVPESNLHSDGGVGHTTLQSWLRDRGFHADVISFSPSIVLDASNYDALIVVLPAGGGGGVGGVIPSGLVPSIQKLVAAGKGLLVIGALKHDTMSAEGTLVSAAAGGGTTHQTFNSIFQLLGYRQGGSGENHPVSTAINQGLGLRVVDSEHPISRSLASGSVYRSIGNAGEATTVPVLSGQMIAEQGIILGDGQEKSTLGLSSVPAIVANSVRVNGQNGTAEGRTAHFNFLVNPYFGVSSQLFERSLMWISHSIAEEIKDAEDNNN